MDDALDLAAIDARAWEILTAENRARIHTLVFQMARTDVPVLVARVRALEAENAALRGIAHEGLAWAWAFVDGDAQRACVAALQRQLLD